LPPIQSPIARIDRLVLRTTEFDRLCAFYVELAGECVPAPFQGPNGRAILFDFFGVGLELIESSDGCRREHGSEPGCASVVFALGSADAVDLLTVRLASAGYTVRQQPRRMQDGCYRSAVLDPDGNRVGLTV
jgi:predicted enzyme related to lactoylglutathione lyase